MNKKYRIYKGPDVFPEFVKPVGAGHETINSTNYRWKSSDHASSKGYFFIQYTLSGFGMFKHENSIYKIDKGMAFLARYDELDYEYFFNGKVPHWEFVWIGMSGLSGEILFKSIQNNFGNVVNIGKDCYTVKLMFECLNRGMSSSWKNESIKNISLFCHNFLHQLFEDIKESSSPESQERLEKAIQYFKNNFHKNINVTTVSNEFDYSREHFTRLFRQKTGMSPGRYLQELKLSKSKELLRATDYNLEKIAEEVGISDSNYLCRLFRNNYGLTPVQYKKSFDATIV